MSFKSPICLEEFGLTVGKVVSRNKLVRGHIRNRENLIYSAIAQENLNILGELYRREREKFPQCAMGKIPLFNWN